jgi:hypothetical protein
MADNATGVKAAPDKGANGLAWTVTLPNHVS